MKIAVYGGSGYEGKLVSSELGRRNMEMVLAGRNIMRLRDAATEAGVVGAELQHAELDDPTALADAFHDCDAVINCAGPFTLSGDAVARAAIDAGCHYLDTTGEQLYMKQIFDTLGEDAESAGISVIPAMTDGGLTADLVAHLAAEQVAPVEVLTTAHRLAGGGAASRGTLRSALVTAENFKDGGLSYEDGAWRTGTPVRQASFTFPGDSEASAVAKLAAPEVVTIPRHVRTRHVESVADPELIASFTAVTPERIDDMPEGPTEDRRRATKFTFVADVLGTDGRKARGVVQGSDTYGTTAIIAVEGARRLVANGAPAGVLAPAQAYDPADFLDFLGQHDVYWSVDVI